MVLKSKLYLLMPLIYILIQPAYAQERQNLIQKGPTRAEARMKSWEHHVRLKNESVFKDLKWRAVGPKQQGGRIEAIAVPPGNHGTIYAGPGSGNIWKTVKNGLTW